MVENPAHGTTLQGLEGTEYISRLLRVLIAGAFVAGVLVFTYIFISGAVSWISAGGDKGKVEAAKDKVTKGLIGLVIMLFVFAIVNVIGCVIGINILEAEIGEFNVRFTGSVICGN